MKSELKRCIKCILPSTSAIPITFNKNGVCSACKVADEKKNINWAERQADLKKILEE